MGYLIFIIYVKPNNLKMTKHDPFEAALKLINHDKFLSLTVIFPCEYIILVYLC